MGWTELYRANMRYDFMVLGAGISGASAAYRLKKGGAKRVLLLDRGEAASGGTGRSATIKRQSYSTPLLMRLVRAGMTMLDQAGHELGKEAGYVKAGYCLLLSEVMLEGARRNLATQKGLGIVNEWRDGRGFPKDNCAVDPNYCKATADRNLITDVQARMQRRYPAFGGMWLLQAYAALYDVTPDRYPFVGPRAGLDGYADVCGGRGQGFKIAPAMDEEPASWLLTGRTANEFRQLSHDRIAEGRLFVQSFGGNRGCGPYQHLTGNVSRPRRTGVSRHRRFSAGCTNRKSGNRPNRLAKAISASILARCAPRQKWMP